MPLSSLFFLGRHLPDSGHQGLRLETGIGPFLPRPDLRDHHSVPQADHWPPRVTLNFTLYSLKVPPALIGAQDWGPGPAWGMESHLGDSVY